MRQRASSPSRARRTTRGPCLGWAGVALVLVVLALATTADAARSEPQERPEDPMPSYVLPNILAVGMGLTVLAIACKRFRKE